MVELDHPFTPIWVCEQLGYEFLPAIERCAARVVDDQIVAGIVLHVYTGHDVHVTLAAAYPGAMSPGLLKAAGRIAWDDLGCGRLSFQTANPAAARLACALGAHLEGTKRDPDGDGGAAWMFGLFRHNWRFRRAV